MKEEGFLKDVDAVSDFKFRAGYGITGQQEGIGDYTYFASYTPIRKEHIIQFWVMASLTVRMPIIMT